jgi:hypothetical protein
MSGLSMYYLAKTVAKRENRRIMGLSSALFYMFNFYPIFLFWRPGTLHSFFYATIPLILGLYIQLLRTKKKLYMVTLLFVLTVVFVPIATNPAYVIILFLILFLYLLFHIYQKRRVRVEILSALKYSIYLLLLWFFLNMWWILPVLPFINESLAGASVVGGTLEIVRSASSQTNFLNLFRLLGPWVFTSSGWGGDPYFPWAWVYATIPFLIIGFIPVILAFVPFLLNRKSKIIFFFASLLLLGLFLMKGVHPPLGQIIEWSVVNIKPSALFRSPYDKFGIMAALSYSILVGIGFGVLYSYLNKYRRYVAKTIVILLSMLLFVVYMWPYWTGDIISAGGKTTPSARIRVPNYYYQAGEWIKNQPEEFKIYSLPYQEGAAYNWEHGYFGSDDPTLHFFQKPILSSTMIGIKATSLYLHNLVDLFYSYDITTIITKMLGLTNIKYVLIHNDVNYFVNTPDLTIKAENIKSILTSQKGIHLEKSFGKLDLYKISDQYFLPHIYPTATPILVKGSLDDMLDVVTSDNFTIGNNALFLSDQISKSQWEFLDKYSEAKSNSTPTITFEKMNPTRCEVKVENATSPFFLVFSESYHSEWRAYVENKPFMFNDLIAEYENVGVKEARHEMKFTPADISYLFKKPINEDRHFLVNGYANSWYVDPKEIGRTDFVITLYFKPQSYFYLGLFISGITLIGCVVFLFWSWQKVKKQKAQILMGR